MVGQSEVISRIFDPIREVADSDSTGIIMGETGTGKELIAHAIHHNSARRYGPLITMNSAVIPEGLLERELFGNDRGGGAR